MKFKFLVLTLGLVLMTDMIHARVKIRVHNDLDSSICVGTTWSGRGSKQQACIAAKSKDWYTSGPNLCTGVYIDVKQGTGNTGDWSCCGDQTTFTFHRDPRELIFASEFKYRVFKGDDGTIKVKP